MMSSLVELEGKNMTMYDFGIDRLLQWKKFFKVYLILKVVVNTTVDILLYLLGYKPRPQTSNL